MADDIKTPDPAPATPATPEPAAPAEKTYTQAEVNAAAAAARKDSAADAKAGKEAIARLAEMEAANLSEVEKANKVAADAVARAEAAEAKAANVVLDSSKQRIGAELGIPEALRSRLTGTTEEEIRADATALAPSFRPAGQQVGGGGRPAADGTTPTVEELEGLSMAEYAAKMAAPPK